MLHTGNETRNSGDNTEGTTKTANNKICSWRYYMEISPALPEI
jgi:hypothetical protein